MIPAARIASAIELLVDIEEKNNQPADRVAASFWLARRYMGAKDRRAISDRIWGVLRRRARLGWWLEKNGVYPTARLLVIADMLLHDRLKMLEITNIFSGKPNVPAPLSSIERSIASRIEGHDLFHHDMPDWVRGEYPDWLDNRLRNQFGKNLAMEMGVLRDEAPVDLRVNSLKIDRDKAKTTLADIGFQAKETQWSPFGLRLQARIALSAQSIFRDGLVEVQDEGSQIIAILTDARPGQNVMDFCAGAGGKTLALAASMNNKGKLLACDVHKGRAEKAKARLRRAGVHNVTSHLLEGKNDKWLKRQSERFDRVLVDAPCSGSGTWRRNPDSKWRVTPEILGDLVATQAEILQQTAKLVKKGGRLIYATCSLLPEENEKQISVFLNSNADFLLIDFSEIWKKVLLTPPPCSGPFLHLTPFQHGTDGFFAAILMRQNPPAPL